MKIMLCLAAFTILIAALSAQRFATLDDNNIYIYEKSVHFSGGKQIVQDNLVYTQPRYTVLSSGENVNQNISNVVSYTKRLISIAEILTQSRILNMNLVGSGLPGFISVSWGYQEGTGWKWYVSCPEYLWPIFSNYWEMTNPNQSYYFIGNNAQPSRVPGVLNF